MSITGNILAVDDESGITDYLAHVLGREGLHVDTASGGWEAWDQIQAGSYDLVISDVRMDKGDGIELLEKIRGMQSPKPKIALMSAFTDVSISDVYERGAVALIQKPATSAAIVAVVKKSLLQADQIWVEKDVPTDSAIDLAFTSFDEAVKRGLLAIGHGGLFVKADQHLPPVDGTVSFTLNFSEAKPSQITGIGIVRWARARAPRHFYQGIGLEFCSLDAGARVILRAWIDRERPGAFIPIGLVPACARE